MSKPRKSQSGSTQTDDLRRKAEKALRESEERFRSLVEMTSDWIWTVDRDGFYTYASPKLKDLLGYEPDEVIGRTPFDLMPPDEAERVRALFEDHVKSRKPIRGLENVNLHKDGRRVVLETSGAAILDADGNLLGYGGIDRDITQRKRAEEQLRASLREKEVLLKEIHHRVKNNLQVVSSLLSLQAEQTKDRQTFEAFRESQNRIRSMSLVHEKLYRSPDLTRIDFAEYVPSLATALFRSYRVDAATITLNLDVAQVFLDIDTVIPCGLIINELVSNSLKHAFPAGRAGEIRITLRPAGDNLLTLVVGDNGVGLPQDLDLRHAGSLGLQLVNTLVSQLGGTITLHRHGGTEFEITLATPGSTSSRLDE